MIPYCFVDQRSYDKLHCAVNSAIKLWADALERPGVQNGGKRGPENGHSLVFVSHGRKTGGFKKNVYCCDSYRYGTEGEKLDKDRDLRCYWNKERYSADTLAIHWLDEVKAGGASKASLGYTDGTVEGRHWLRVMDGADPSEIAHELGHG